MSDYLSDFAQDVSMIVTVYDDRTDRPNRGAWRHRVKAWIDSEPTEAVIDRAIEEWAAIRGGPDPTRPNEPTLAHYIAASLFAPRAVASGETPTEEQEADWEQYHRTGKGSTTGSTRFPTPTEDATNAD